MTHAEAKVALMLLGWKHYIAIHWSLDNKHWLTLYPKQVGTTPSINIYMTDKFPESFNTYEAGIDYLSKLHESPGIQNDHVLNGI